MLDDFKVIIVGGSVAGLSLAHCLERLGISFTVLEQQNQISPHLGASIGILPNGARIFDQLGIFSAIENETEALEIARIRYLDGFSFESQYPKVLGSNFGYPVSFLERHKFLEILYDKLQRKNQIHKSQKVVAVENYASRAVVKTADGTEYVGDLVVGADGVHSLVRSEIWKLANETSQATMKRSDIKFEYSCIYGISLNVPHIEPGVQLSLLDDDLTIHLFPGKQSKAFWFIIVKTMQSQCVEKQWHTSYTARRICEGLQSKKLDKNLFFEDVWSKCKIFKMTPLEEGIFKRWHCGRLVCIGDAIRKMAPNIGQGANMAIEDAARLASLLSQRLSAGKLSFLGIDMLLQEFTAVQQARTKSVCAQSEFLVRMQANQGIGRKFLGRYIIPFLSDAPAGFSGFSMNGAARIEYLGLPARSLVGSWNGSWRCVFQSLSCFRPRACKGHFVYLLAITIMIYLVR
ncbi:FAD dependent monooxygenase [Whalleya microplaca]|nr:FAD dependent monooxygenase [Whalleya microplaca]